MIREFKTIYAFFITRRGRIWYRGDDILWRLGNSGRVERTSLKSLMDRYNVKQKLAWKMVVSNLQNEE